jgi:hypothetical protein
MGFQGYGYDDDFVENMNLVNSQRKLDTTTISVINSPDDICRACPNLKDGICEDTIQNERIVAMDNEVLKKLDSSMEYDAIELFKKVDNHFSTKESVSEICSNCIWHEKCLFYQKLVNYR